MAPAAAFDHQPVSAFDHQPAAAPALAFAPSSPLPGVIQASVVRPPAHPPPSPQPAALRGLRGLQGGSSPGTHVGSALSQRRIKLPPAGPTAAARRPLAFGAATPEAAAASAAQRAGADAPPPLPAARATAPRQAGAHGAGRQAAGRAGGVVFQQAGVPLVGGGSTGAALRRAEADLSVAVCAPYVSALSAL
ncbi:hypothetical protein T484DRAFT_1901675 [Baffinella frigidus]|nr:hypothetical protein T484DRAFT_1901675 [Cryptophyta sp. CCMP2293]